MSLVAVKTNERGTDPKYYLGMLEGRPRFGPKKRAVRMSDDLAEMVARQLQQGWKIDCSLMDGFVRFGSKAPEAT